jgi:TRAP-type C4-dicarboxylate transport system substrate-binding protein
MSKEREKEGNETLQKNGMTVQKPDAPMQAAFRKVGEQISAEWQKSAGPDGAALMKAYQSK